jgi:hypothetical protein
MQLPNQQGAVVYNEKMERAKAIIDSYILQH